jgi:hypothetical protein
VEEWKFDDVSELDEILFDIIGGLCGWVNCSYMDEELLNFVLERGELFVNVEELLKSMVGGNSWYEGEGMDEFIEKYGDREGISWGIEYDSNCSVMLKGDWFELRKEWEEEIKKRDWE